jgi:ABC-type polysaccharide/polyol phosphate export permease
MREALKRLIEYRELLYMITYRDITIKYKQTVLGFLWAILMPIIIIGAGLLVKYAFSRASGKPFLLSEVATLAVKAIPWAFVVSSLRFASISLVSNSNLVTKIYFPREIFPVASLLSQLFDFAAAACLLTLILIVAQIGVSIHLLWVPVLLAVLVCFCLGLGLFVSAACLFFRDVKYIVEVVLTFAIFFTPVFYEASLFGEFGKYLLLNPVAPILESLNDCIVMQKMPDLVWLSYSGAISFALAGLGLKFFQKLEPKFAECI